MSQTTDLPDTDLPVTDHRSLTTTTSSRPSEPPRSRIGVVVGTTRPGRKAADVADWVTRIAVAQPGASEGRVGLAALPLQQRSPRWTERPFSSSGGGGPAGRPL